MKYKAENRPFNVILITICSFVGVGFITGAEIWFYFARFEANAIFGLLCFGILSFFLILFSFYSKNNENISPKFAIIKEKQAQISELLIASAMISGLMETSKTLFGGWWLAIFLCAVIVISIILWLGLKSFILYNYILTIFVIFVIISLFKFNNNNLYKFDLKFDFKKIILACLFSSIYIFMNISEIRPILQKLDLNTKAKTKKSISLIISSILIFLIFALSIVLISNKNITLSSMPFLIFFNNNGGFVKWVYLTGLILAMISTAETCMFGVKDKLKISKNDKNYSNVLVILSALIIGQIPFLFFIKIVYPIIAISNFILFILEIFERRKILTKLK